MRREYALGAAILAGLAFWGWSKREEALTEYEPGGYVERPIFTVPDWVPIEQNNYGDFEMIDNRRLKAFLFMITASEHDLNDARNGTAYRVFYSHSARNPNLFTDLSDHPVLTGEKKGVPLHESMCVAAGFKKGCVSTAAGAYQIIRPTWERVRKAGAWGPRLPDFSPASQDEAARRILIEARVLPLLDVDMIEEAIIKASRQWASLPGSTAEQGGRSMPYAVARFEEGLTHA